MPRSCCNDSHQIEKIQTAEILHSNNIQILNQHHIHTGAVETKKYNTKVPQHRRLYVIYKIHGCYYILHENSTQLVYCRTIVEPRKKRGGITHTHTLLTTIHKVLCKGKHKNPAVVA